MLLAFPGVRQAVVFGRESLRRNEEVAACIAAERPIAERELIAHCGARLSSWQVPKRLFFVDKIPANERGKISRREVALRFGARHSP